MPKRAAALNQQSVTLNRSGQEAAAQKGLATLSADDMTAMCATAYETYGRLGCQKDAVVAALAPYGIPYSDAIRKHFGRYVVRHRVCTVCYVSAARRHSV